MSAEMIEPELVQHTDNMDTETFALHMEHRHPESLAGMIPLWFTDDYVEECYRSFHRQLHRFNQRLGHGHDHFRMEAQ
jgi:hypothetical protein